MPSYLLLDKHGEPIDLIDNLQEALNAADQWSSNGSVYLDAPTEQDFELIQAGEKLAANPPRLRVVGSLSAPEQGLRAVAKAMGRRLGDAPLIDYDAAMAMSLPQAHARLEPYFPTKKSTSKGFAPVYYDEPLAMANKFLGQNYKTEKGTPKNIISMLRERTGFSKASVLGLSLLPSTQSYTESMVTSIMSDARSTYGVEAVKKVRLNACTRATSECASSCLAFSGRNLADDYNTVKKYALLQSLVHEPEAFVRMLWEAISIHQDRSIAAKVMPLVRLNVFSDLPWELMVPRLFEDFPSVQFYDYTKVPERVTPSNYDLTFSFAGTERNVASMDEEIKQHGRRVAVVFAAVALKRLYEVNYQLDGKKMRLRTGVRQRIVKLAQEHGTTMSSIGETPIPTKPTFQRKKPGGKKAVQFDAKLPDDFLGLPVVDGDESDMRPYDPAPSIVGLRWKTPANQGVTLEEASVFVVLVDVVPIGGGYSHCIVSKTARFDDVDYAEYAPDITD